MLRLTSTILITLGFQSFLGIMASARTYNSASQCHVKQVNGDPNKIVCVCNEQYCETLRFDWPQSSGQARLVQSSEGGKRFESSTIISLTNQTSRRTSLINSILVDLQVEHQTVLGWGGAFTDAFGYNLRNLSASLARQLIESYFGPGGLQYNFGRVPIGGSDFSTHAYSLDDSDQPDYDLAKWSLATEDTQLKIPYIKMAREIATRNGTELKLFASPWSPPKWMKNSNNLVRGFLIDDDKIYRSYTNYLLKFFDAYESEGIGFWGATVQNEPVASFLPFYYFNSLEIGNEQMVKFISKYYGPALVASGRTKDKFKLMIGDDSLGMINYQVPTVMRDPEVSKYIAGLAFHWYTSGTIVPYSALTRVYEATRNQIEFMMMSEACTGSVPMTKKVDFGSWERGQAYAVDIIEDFRRHTGAWIDWNMALDMQGGPNWSGNFVDSPILVNASNNEFYKQPMYYALAHFSRFFRPGSVVVESKVKGSRFATSSDLMTVAAHKKDTGHLIVNILNKGDRSRKVTLQVRGSDEQKLKTDAFEVEAKSISSLIVKL